MHEQSQDQDHILFLNQSIPNIHRTFTAAQIGTHPVRTFADIQETCLPEVEYIFSTWGFASMTEDEWGKHFPNLKAVLYAAGTVQAFAEPLLNRGVRVFSAWAANAIPVAEFAAAQIVLANKGYFQLHKRYQQSHKAALTYGESFAEGNYGGKVGLLGAGMIGRHVIRLLAPYAVQIYAFDPFLSEAQAAALGVIKADLETIFRECRTISNHLANKAETRGMLDYSLFSQMLPNATFINTGRGAQVAAADLCRAMSDSPDRTALLDVTDPEEPAAPDSEYWKHPNILLTPHRAGSMVNEVRRMGQYMFEEYEKLLAGEAVRYEVTKEMLATMA